MAKKACLKCGFFEDPSGLYSGSVCWTCANEMIDGLENGSIYMEPRKNNSNKLKLDRIAQAFKQKQLFFTETRTSIPHQKTEVVNVLMPDPKPPVEKDEAKKPIRKSKRIKKGESQEVPEDDQPDEAVYNEVSNIMNRSY